VYHGIGSLSNYSAIVNGVFTHIYRLMTLTAGPPDVRMVEYVFPNPQGIKVKTAIRLADSTLRVSLVANLLGKASGVVRR